MRASLARYPGPHCVRACARLLRAGDPVRALSRLTPSHLAARALQRRCAWRMRCIAPRRCPRRRWRNSRRGSSACAQQACAYSWRGSSATRCASSGPTTGMATGTRGSSRSRTHASCATLSRGRRCARTRAGVRTGDPIDRLAAYLLRVLTREGAPMRACAHWLARPYTHACAHAHSLARRHRRTFATRRRGSGRRRIHRRSSLPSGLPRLRAQQRCPRPPSSSRRSSASIEATAAAVAQTSSTCSPR